MMGNCEICGDPASFDYCPLCAEWFCTSCWGECGEKDCAGCTAIMSAYAR